LIRTINKKDKSVKYNAQYCQVNNKKLFRLVCPIGFSWFDHQGCVALIEIAATKDNALTQCQSLNPAAKLFMPKTGFRQLTLEQFGSNKTSTKLEVFLGMSKIDGNWIWDDGTPVFVRCKLD
jgi:hypothetical protein